MEIETECQEDNDQRKTTLAYNLFERLRSMEFKARVRSCRERINLEILIDIVWPKVSASDKKLILSWLKEFKMNDVVRRFFLKVINDEPSKLSPKDIKYIFDHLDVNKDGNISMKEFRRYGFLTKKEVKQLFAKFDFGEKDKSLQIEELMKSVFQPAQSDFADCLKTAFANVS